LHHDAVAGEHADAIIGKILHYAVGNCQAATRVEDHPIVAHTATVERQPTQDDGVVCPSADGDGVSLGGWHDAGLDPIRTGDGDSFGDVNRPKPRAVDGGDLGADASEQASATASTVSGIAVCMASSIAMAPRAQCEDFSTMPT